MKHIFLFLIIFSVFFANAEISLAIEDPLKTANNRIGVHILFTEELNSARDLVNSSGGDWGYVTIPIQSGDRDMEKWQKFMDNAKTLHIIPIIRLATEGNYFNTSVWRKPTKEDVLDFANFLDSLSWPVKNRYIIVFNEVNRGDEWEGSPNPEEYADILNYASDIFKSKNADFFIISAGLDNASANVPGKSINQYDFMTGMNRAIPGIFNKIDGLGSHSYPNPAFSQAPWVITDKSISSFKFEKSLVYGLSGKNLPVFITETGWSRNNLSENLISSYFEYAFESVWLRDIVAVTPFLLRAGIEPFSQFTLLNADGNYNDISSSIKKISKTEGKPAINPGTNSASKLPADNNNLPLETFPQKNQYDNPIWEKTNIITHFLKWFLKLTI